MLHTPITTEFCPKCDWKGTAEETEVFCDENGWCSVFCPKCSTDITYVMSGSEPVKETNSIKHYAFLLLSVLFVLLFVATLLFCLIVATILYVFTFFKYADPKKLYWQTMNAFNAII